MMNPGAAIISGAGMGALLMYFLDPDRGRRRRAMVQDQATKARRKLSDAADATARDVRHRGSGLWWELQTIRPFRIGSAPILACWSAIHAPSMSGSGKGG